MLYDDISDKVSDTIRHYRHEFEGKIMAENLILGGVANAANGVYSSNQASFQQDTPALHYPAVFTGIEQLPPASLCVFAPSRLCVMFLSFAFAAPRPLATTEMAQISIAAGVPGVVAVCVAI